MIDDILPSIDSRAAMAYLSVAGWTQVAESDLGSKWRFDDGDRRRNVAIPSSALDDADRAAMFSATLRVLEEVERRPAREIVSRLADAARDVVRFRLISPELRDGEMPLMAAPDLLAGSRDALKYAARSAFRSRPHYPRSGTLPADVNGFLDGARVGSSEKGSVILTVRSDIDEATPSGQLPFLPETERSPATIPFERRALRRLLDGVNAAKSASHKVVTDENVDTVFDDDMESGLSANLCDALLALSGEQLDIDADLEISVRWSLLVPSLEPEARASISAVEIKRLEGVADFLRSINPLNDLTLTGGVKKMSHTPSAPDGWAEIGTEYDGRGMTVKVHLADDEIDVAWRAFGLNDTHELSITGTIERNGRVWEMTKPQALAVVPRTGPKAA